MIDLTRTREAPMRKPLLAVIAALAMLVLPAPRPLMAQPAAPPGCLAMPFTDPPRTIFRCAGGLVIEAEEAARLSLVPGRAGQPPAAATLDGNAALIDIAPRRGRFQILTPHAIASVRGTVYAVDVTAGMTSVFVAEGRVRVSRRDGSEPVDLAAGEGVDVRPDAPLTVRRWPADRAARQLARLGR